MKKIGDTVNKLVRDSGASLGLEYPYVFAHDLDAYLIWHRDTGLVMWVGEEGMLGADGYHVAWIKAIELNGRNPYKATRPDDDTCAICNAPWRQCVCVKDEYSPFDNDSVE